MLNYVIRVFIFHLLVATVYLGITSYWFVTKGFNPIKTGLQQDLLMLIHLTVATIFPLPNKNILKKKHIINFSIVLLIIITYFLLSNWIWNWLWQLR